METKAPPTRGQRLTERTATSFAGALMSTDGAYIGHCIVNNMSPTGAKLSLVVPVRLPEELVLTVKDSGIRWPCALIRQDELEAGIRFT